MASLPTEGNTKYLSELKINCDYSDRGCHEHIRLEELDSHVENCGFAPVKCSNEECEMVINKREIIHHESAVCEYRKVKCHSCVKIEQDVKDMQGKIEKEAQVTKSIKHREKIQTLEALEEENMIKLGPPVKCFAEDKRFLLGKGSMGTSVYVGILEDASEVAVKRMLKESCEDAAENEMRILSLINAKKSPFIVSYRHFVMDNTFIYLIVDLCEQTLDKYFRSQNNLKINGRRMIKEVLTGLKFLHDQGILHRDLKPSNVLVDVEGHMRLADFGISRVLNEDETTFLTHAKGTQGWMAAEVIEDIDKVSKGRFKKKSDIQPAGMIAFFILTKGEHPFGSTLKSYKLMANIVDGNAVNLHNLVDLDAHQFVSRLVCHEMHNRPSAHEALLLPFLDNID